MLVSVVKGLVSLGSWEAIKGIGIWCQLTIGTKPMWIQGAEAQAQGRLVGVVKLPPSLMCCYPRVVGPVVMRQLVRSTQKLLVCFILRRMRRMTEVAQCAPHNTS